MNILETYRQVILQVIATYQTEKQRQGKQLTLQRQIDIAALNQIIEESKEKNQRDVILLRVALVKFVQELKVPPGANILSFLDSDFRQRLKAILNDPDYDPDILSARERAEAKEREEAILPYLNDAQKVTELLGQVNTLKELLAAEKIITSHLTNTITNQNTAYATLSENHAELSTNYATLEAENKQLKIENAQLKRQPLTTQPHVEQSINAKTEQSLLTTFFKIKIF